MEEGQLVQKASWGQQSPRGAGGIQAGEEGGGEIERAPQAEGTAYAKALCQSGQGMLLIKEAAWPGDQPSQRGCEHSQLKNPHHFCFWSVEQPSVGECWVNE